MQTISIVPPPIGDSRESGRFRAIAGMQQASGKTTGEALDSLSAQLGPGGTTLVLIQKQQPDEFFTQSQHDRMRELMARRDTLASNDRAELEALIDSELDATVARTDALIRQLNP